MGAASTFLKGSKCAQSTRIVGAPNHDVFGGVVAKVFPEAFERRTELPFGIQPDDSAFFHGGENLLDPIQDSVHFGTDQRARFGNLQQEYVVYRRLPVLRSVLKTRFPGIASRKWKGGSAVFESSKRRSPNFRVCMVARRASRKPGETCFPPVR
jgi:hypothetical protein